MLFNQLVVWQLLVPSAFQVASCLPSPRVNYCLLQIISCTCMVKTKVHHNVCLIICYFHYLHFSLWMQQIGLLFQKCLSFSFKVIQIRKMALLDVFLSLTIGTKSVFQGLMMLKRHQKSKTKKKALTCATCVLPTINGTTLFLHTLFLFIMYRHL